MNTQLQVQIEHVAWLLAMQACWEKRLFSASNTAPRQSQTLLLSFSTLSLLALPHFNLWTERPLIPKPWVVLAPPPLFYTLPSLLCLPWNLNFKSLNFPISSSPCTLFACFPHHKRTHCTLFTQFELTLTSALSFSQNKIFFLREGEILDDSFSPCMPLWLSWGPCSCPPDRLGVDNSNLSNSCSAFLLFVYTL